MFEFEELSEINEFEQNEKENKKPKLAKFQFISNEKINSNSNYQPIRFNLVCKNWNQIIQSPFFSNILFKSFFSRDFQFIIDLDPNIKYENVKDWKSLYFGNYLFILV